MTLAVGTVVLDRYEVRSLLGEGGMGKVYLGRHQRLDMPVALKVLTPTGMPGMTERFEREALLMARVRHPNVVAILDYGLLDDGSPCIAMEYAQGEPLDRLVERKGVLPHSLAVSIAVDILNGLHALHAASVLHRDLKPSNVILINDQRPTAKLIDFGIALGTGEDADERLTRTGSVVGTPTYMAPEQLLCYPMDARADLYSAALILYRMLCGSLPFPGNDLSTVMRRLRDPIPAPRAPAGMSPIPPHIVQAVLAALSVEADSRPANAAQFVERLSQVAAPQQPPADSGALDETGVLDESQLSSLLQQSDVLNEPEHRFLIGASILPSVLRNPQERRWLAQLVAPHGRSFSLGARFWFALSNHKAPAPQARSTANSLQKQLQEHYGPTCKVECTLVDPSFTITAASLTGATPMPPELAALVEKLA